MSLRQFLTNRLGWAESETGSGSCEVEIQDGRIVGNPYHNFGSVGLSLSDSELGAAYEKISCVGTSIDLIANNMQMIEPVFWDDKTRTSMDIPSDKKLILLRNRLEKPNSIDNRKTFISKSVKNYNLFGVVYYAFVFGSDNSIISIKILDNNLINPTPDVSNSRIDSYRVSNAGSYTGEYTFNGTYYVNTADNKKILAPYMNSSPDYQYLPASVLQGTGIEALMYWYGCYHNKSLLSNGARPSLIFLIKSLLNPKHREQLREEIRIRHSGAGNAGSAIIIDGAADKDVKQFSQNNKDMEFNAVLESAESAIYKRLGTNWVLGKNINSKDLQKGMELLFDMTICPQFQAIFNHIFDVFKYFNSAYNHLRVFYLEQDIPALRPRFLAMMKDMPNLGIFTVKERRAMFHYEPLGDERDDELAVQSVKVTQTGNSGTNDTAFSGN